MLMQDNVPQQVQTTWYGSISSSTLPSDVEAAAMRRGKDGGSEESMVVPLLLQNKPPVVPGKEEDELADVDLRPDQVREGKVWDVRRSGVVIILIRNCLCSGPCDQS